MSQKEGGDRISGLVIEAIDLRKAYSLGKLQVEAVRDVNLKISFGDFVALTGPSGSGKSTLLNLMGALDRPTTGIMLIGGADISEARRDKLVEMRRRIGFVFQSFNLVPRLSARENVELGMNIAGINRNARRTRAEELLMLVGLEDRADHKPNELSGGQQQRVAIARALANDSQLLLMDEPTGNLDSRSTQSIMALVEQLNRNNHLTIIIVTHDWNIAMGADRVVCMLDGVVEKELFNR